jgi:tetratricopeptide (TPR) repeat protein
MPGRNDPPTIKSGRAKDPARQLIPIQPGGASLLPAKRKPIDRLQFWLNYFTTHGEEKDAVPRFREDLAVLNAYKKFEDVRCSLTAFMIKHPKLVEPWMYNALALAIKENRGSEDDFRKALKFAGDTAERSHNPNHLVNAADLLFLNGEYARAGKLIDEATERVPHQSIPLMMSINLALATRDPARMAGSIDRLLSLGWPGEDDKLRRDARRVAEALAKSLREAGRDKDADELLARLHDSEARDLFIRLTWAGRAALDLSVEDPLGVTCGITMTRSVSGGSLVKNAHGKNAECVYVCPRAFDGEYKVHVDTFFNDPEKPAATALLEVITHEGTPEEHKETHTIVLSSKGASPVVVKVKGGRRKVAMPFLAPARPDEKKPAENAKSKNLAPPRR